MLLAVAEIYRRLNQPERALVALHALIDAQPPGEESQQLLYLQGLALTAMRRDDDAIESFSLANVRGRPRADILYQQAEAEYLAGRVGNSQIALRQALLLEPNHATSRALLERLRVANSSPLPDRR